MTARGVTHRAAEAMKLGDLTFDEFGLLSFFSAAIEASDRDFIEGTLRELRLLLRLPLSDDALRRKVRRLADQGLIEVEISRRHGRAFWEVRLGRGDRAELEDALLNRLGEVR